MKEGGRFVAVAAVAVLLYLPTVRPYNLGDCGASSRLATAESLVERGTFAIDDSTFAYTCDRIMLDGRLYSDKPPLLSVATAALYGALHHGLGMRFEPDSRPVTNPLPDRTYGLLTVLVVVLAQALLVATFDRALGRFGLAGWRRLGAAASLGFATLLWPLAGLFNPQTVAAAAVFGGLYAALLSRRPRPLTAGLLLGFGAAVDIPVGGLALAAGWLAAPTGRLRFGCGAAIPVAVHLAFNVAIVGDVIPFQLHRELYNETTGHAGSAVTGFDSDRSLGFYLVRNLVGSLGVFSLTPLLALALGLAVARLLRPQPGTGPSARFTAVAVGLFVAGAGLYTAAWPDAVGCSYGMRHVAPVTAPLLLVAAAAAVRSRRLWTGYLALAAVSAVIAAVGLLSPATCTGFHTPDKAHIPAYTFLENVRAFLLPQLR